MYDHFVHNVGYYWVGMLTFIHAFLIGQIYGGWLARRNLIADMQPRHDRARMQLKAMVAWSQKNLPPAEAEFQRADGRCLCERCGYAYQDHPQHPRDEYLTLLCDGRSVKL
jgi:hypothetical protein